MYLNITYLKPEEEIIIFKIRASDNQGSAVLFSPSQCKFQVFFFLNEFSEFAIPSRGHKFHGNYRVVMNALILVGFHTL